MRIMNPHRSSAPQPEVPSHLFAVGQAVRRKGGFGRPASHLDVFRITATLPESGGSPQYRIRNEDERHERVSVEEDLEAVDGGHFSPPGRTKKNALDQLFAGTGNTTKD